MLSFNIFAFSIVLTPPQPPYINVKTSYFGDNEWSLIKLNVKQASEILVQFSRSYDAS